MGQEIYGAGAAAVFAVRSFHRFDGVPFELFCDSFLLAIDRPADNALIVQLAGAPTAEALLALCALSRKRLPKVRVELDGKAVRARQRERRREYRVPAGATIELTW